MVKVITRGTRCVTAAGCPCFSTRFSSTLKPSLLSPRKALRGDLWQNVDFYQTYTGDIVFSADKCSVATRLQGLHDG